MWVSGSVGVDEGVCVGVGVGGGVCEMKYAATRGREAPTRDAAKLLVL